MKYKYYLLLSETKRLIGPTSFKEVMSIKPNMIYLVSLLKF